MCGIFGYNVQENKALPLDKINRLGEFLGEFNDRRGGHSWGVASNDEDVMIIQRGLGPIAKSNVKLNARRLIGHTRWATKGKISVKNAHPFESGDIIGAHNGQVWNHDDLNMVYGRSHECDSEHLFSHLSENAPFDDIEGYGAIEWYDFRKGENPFVCKLSGGSLAVCGIGREGACVGTAWSSDKSHLFAALRLARLPFFSYTISEGQAYMTRNDGLYKLPGQRLRLMERQFKSSYAKVFNMWDYLDDELDKQLTIQLARAGNK